ncbi:MAG: PqqD family protein [Planctomycetes bacterium]|nr:PqqD family protein [Planctomycetota bacterium]
MRYARREDVVARSVAGANLLVPIHRCTSSVYTLNGVGRWMWDLIASPRTADELAGAVVAQHGIPREAAERDVRVFLEDLLRMGLAEERE